MEHQAKLQNRRRWGRLLPVAFGEGFLAGAAGEIFQEYLSYPLAMWLIAFYTAFRVGYVHRPAFLLGALFGFIVPSFSLPPGSNVLVPLMVIMSYYLFSGAHFFATYQRTLRSWVVTGTWAVLAALLVSFIFLSPLSVLLFPAFWLCFLPLWSANLRILHSLFFALVYLVVIHWGSPQSHSSWPLWVAVTGMSLIPELLARLYPERKHKLDSLPVMTPTLNFWQKMRSGREIIFLLIDFYALTMEKYKWFGKIVPVGKYLALAGLLLETGLWLGQQHWLPFVFSFLLVAAGVLLFLGRADYELAALTLGLYALVLGGGRGFWTADWQPAPVALAAVLFLLSVIIFVGRPRETKKEREKWQELNKLP